MAGVKRKLSCNNIDRLNSEIILSFETAIQGGSLSLLRNGIYLDGWVGDKDITTSESILTELSRLLAKNKIDKRLIGKLIYPTGPGSFTGIKIGCAIAKGLSKSIKCEFIGASVLEALLIKSDEDYPVLSAAPIGNRLVVWQIFKNGLNHFNQVNFSVSDENEFFTVITKEYLNKLILYEYLYKKILEINPEIFYENKKIINAGRNPALLLAEQYIDSVKNKKPVERF